jgi:hypothetical protein
MMNRHFAPIATALIALAAVCLPARGQYKRGELRLEVRDPRGAGVEAAVDLECSANQVRRIFWTNAEGNAAALELPFGLYHIRINHEGFVPVDQMLEIHSEVPRLMHVTLGLASMQSHVEVTDQATLIDPERTATVYSIGPRTLSDDIPAQIGRGLTDAVDAQPGWLYESNGVLHPRGSEYGVQYVVDGHPVNENRSPAFAPPFDDNDVDSLQVMTAGFPAEYGRKLGGVIEVNTPQDTPPGWHFKAASRAGSFETGEGDLAMDYARGPNQFHVAANLGRTDRYLDPPVISNFANRGSTGDINGEFARDLSDRDRLRISVSHAAVRHLIPNELVQEEVGQRQDSAAVETSAQADYERVLSPNLLLSAEGSVRDDSFRLWSNALATPAVIAQQRGFREGYARVVISGQHGGHNWKAGADDIFNPVHEALQYAITNPSLFDPATARQFNFFDRGDDREPSVFAQDEYHHGRWNLRWGARFDNYHFLVDRSAVSPRFSASRYFSSAGLLLHASYDRVFQTPALENLLLASSSQVDSTNRLVLRLPVEPAHANFYEVGATKSLFGHIRLDTNLFRRNFSNYSDDDTLLDTGISFPIAFASAWVEGAETKLEMVRWGRFSGFASYSYQEGVGQGPITGGLFIGADDIAGVTDNSRFWVSQDQRHTARTRWRYQATHHWWLASGYSFNSGLPVELDNGGMDYGFLLQQYGAAVLSQVNFARGRVRPSHSWDAATGYSFSLSDRAHATLQFQGTNLANHLNVINFAGLFSGTAIGVVRSFGGQLTVEF